MWEGGGGGGLGRRLRGWEARGDSGGDLRESGGRELGEVGVPTGEEFLDQRHEEAGAAGAGGGVAAVAGGGGQGDAGEEGDAEGGGHVGAEVAGGGKVATEAQGVAAGEARSSLSRWASRGVDLLAGVHGGWASGEEPRASAADARLGSRQRLATMRAMMEAARMWKPAKMSQTQTAGMWAKSVRSLKVKM